MEEEYLIKQEGSSIDARSLPEAIPKSATMIANTIIQRSGMKAVVPPVIKKQSMSLPTNVLIMSEFIPTFITPQNKKE